MSVKQSCVWPWQAPWDGQGQSRQRSVGLRSSRAHHRHGFQDAYLARVSGLHEQVSSDALMDTAAGRWRRPRRCC